MSPRCSARPVARPLCGLSLCLGLYAALALPQESSQLAPLAVDSLLLDIAPAGRRLVAVGERGHVLWSESGATWHQVQVPTRATLTAVYFVDGAFGWAVGHDATILRSVDGGDSWERVFHAPEEQSPLLDVWFADRYRGVAVGAYGMLLISSDGGRSWSRSSVNDELDYHLNSIEAGPDGTVYIAAEAGIVYRSRDLSSWEILEPGYEGSWFTVCPLSETRILVGGLRGHLYASDDGGASWREIDTGTEAMITDLMAIGDDRVVGAGLAGALLYSADGGRSFGLVQRGDRAGLEAIMVGKDARLWGVGEGGVSLLQLP